MTPIGGPYTPEKISESVVEVTGEDSSPFYGLADYDLEDGGSA